MSEVVLTHHLAGLAIREFLQTVGEGSPSDFFKAYRKVKEKASYQSARRYFWILKKLGLIEPTRRELGQSHTIAKQLYRIVPGKENASEWSAPQIAMYPSTRYGGTRYEKAKRRGLI